MVNEINKKSDFERNTKEIIQDSITYILAGLTGIASSKKETIILSAGHIFQGLTKGKFLKQLYTEWQTMVNKGKIKDDYQKTEQHNDLLLDLLKQLDIDTPDEKKFLLLKQIFLVAASETVTNRDSILPLQYLRIAETLSTGEILILSTVYKIVKEDKFNKTDIYAASEWLGEIARHSGLKHSDLVSFYEKNLVEKKLITPRTYSDQSGVIVKPMYRLTPFAYSFCEYISCYDELKSSLSSR